MGLKPEILRAVNEETAATSAPCFVYGTEFVLGPVFAWVNLDCDPCELCEECLRDLSELARKRDLDTPLRDAWAHYTEAKSRYTKPMSTVADMLFMSLEEEGRILDAARLT